MRALAVIINTRVKHLNAAIALLAPIREAYSKYHPLIVAILAAMSAFGIIAPEEATALRDIAAALVP